MAKKTCLSLYFTGPRLYKFLRTIYKLPSVSTLHRFVAHISLKAGINSIVLKHLKYKVASMLPVDRKCIILIDEMSIKSSLTYKRQFQTVCGFVDLGNKIQCPKQANSALVIMLSGLRKKWKQPLAFYFTKGSCPATDLDNIIRGCIKQVSDCGLEVMGLTSDQGSNFSKYFRLQKVTPDFPSLHIDGKEVLVFPDVPHLIKSTRNILYSGNVIATDEGIVAFAPIVSTVIRNQNEELNLLPKITDHHIHLPVFGGKMKVKLATQVLSHSMSAAMRTLIANKLLPVHATPTQVFCHKMNMLFDILNSSTFDSKTPFRQGLKLQSPSWMALENLYDWVKGWKICDQEGLDITNRFKCQNGWLQVITAVKILAEKVINQTDFRCLFTRRLCQDALEHTFGMIRLSGGLRDRPDSCQFVDAFRKLYFQNSLKAPSSSNCSPDDHDTLFDVLDCPDIEDDEESDPDFFCRTKKSTIRTSSVISRNASRYLAGYAARVLRNLHPSCPVCISQCTTVNVNADDLIFTNNKNYYDNITESRGLVACSESFVRHLRECEQVFSQYFETNYHRRRVGLHLENELMKITVHQFCSEKIKQIFTKKFVNQRIFISIKRLNRITSKTSAQKRKTRRTSMTGRLLLKGRNKLKRMTHQ